MVKQDVEIQKLTCLAWLVPHAESDDPDRVHGELCRIIGSNSGRFVVYETSGKCNTLFLVTSMR